MVLDVHVPVRLAHREPRPINRLVKAKPRDTVRMRTAFVGGKSMRPASTLACSLSDDFRSQRKTTPKLRGWADDEGLPQRKYSFSLRVGHWPKQSAWRTYINSDCPQRGLDCSEEYGLWTIMPAVAQRTGSWPSCGSCSPGSHWRQSGATH